MKTQLISASDAQFLSPSPWGSTLTLTEPLLIFPWLNANSHNNYLPDSPMIFSYQSMIKYPKNLFSELNSSNYNHFPEYIRTAYLSQWSWLSVMEVQVKTLLWKLHLLRATDASANSPPTGFSSAIWAPRTAAAPFQNKSLPDAEQWLIQGAGAFSIRRYSCQRTVLFFFLANAMSLFFFSFSFFFFFSFIFISWRLRMARTVFKNGMEKNFNQLLDQPPPHGNREFLKINFK